LTSSKGTTTKLSVAPAEQPVRIDSGWSIFVRPDRRCHVLPQKSFDALHGFVQPPRPARAAVTHNLVARCKARVSTVS
jgi:hypothetical protein